MGDLKKEDLEQTLRILRGTNSLHPVFQKLKEYLWNTHKLTACNFVLDALAHYKPARPRMNVLLLGGHTEYKKVFVRYNFDQSLQQDLAGKFIQLRKGTFFHPLTDMRKLFVCFHDFEHILKERAAEKCGRAIGEQLKPQYPEIWQIHSMFGSFHVFFYSVQQAQEDGTCAIITDAIRAAMSPEDEFGFFEKNPFAVYFDSKEIVDQDYQGNFFYYYR